MKTGLETTTMQRLQWTGAGALLLALSVAVTPACGGDEADDGGFGNGTAGAAAAGGNGTGASASGGTGAGTGGSGVGPVAGSGPGGAAAGASQGCAESRDVAQFVPANLLFVVDKSGSMNCNGPPIDTQCNNPVKVNMAEPSKWEITQAALTGSSGALSTLSGQQGVSVGLTTFPTDDACAILEAGESSVPLAALDGDQLTRLTTELTSTAQGETPLAGAAIRSLEVLRQGVINGELPGNTFLVVMTDGAETCQKPALGDLLAAVEEARLRYGIRTYAIGAPGSEASRRLLSEMAILGGTRRSDGCKTTPTSATESCHVDLTESTDFEADLGAEFQGITNAAAASCEFDVPASALIDLEKVNVEFTSSGGDTELIPQDPSTSCAEAVGWQFNEDSTKVVLCGSVCDDFLKDPGANVDVVYGCRRTVIQ